MRIFYKLEWIYLYRDKNNSYSILLKQAKHNNETSFSSNDLVFQWTVLQV